MDYSCTLHMAHKNSKQSPDHPPVSPPARLPACPPWLPTAYLPAYLPCPLRSLQAVGPRTSARMLLTFPEVEHMSKCA